MNRTFETPFFGPVFLQRFPAFIEGWGTRWKPRFNVQNDSAFEVENGDLDATGSDFLGALGSNQQELLRNRNRPMVKWLKMNVTM